MLFYQHPYAKCVLQAVEEGSQTASAAAHEDPLAFPVETAQEEQKQVDSLMRCVEVPTTNFVSFVIFCPRFSLRPSTLGGSVILAW